MSTPPNSSWGPPGSRRNTIANTIAITTLSLSNGATFEAGASCSAW